MIIFVTILRPLHAISTIIRFCQFLHEFSHILNLKFFIQLKLNFRNNQHPLWWILLRLWSRKLCREQGRYHISFNAYKYGISKFDNSYEKLHILIKAELCINLVISLLENENHLHCWRIASIHDFKLWHSNAKKWMPFF